MVHLMHSIDAPRISVIIAVYNGADYLEQTILSILKQTHPNVELIIIDGASQDNSVNIIKKYADKIKYWISEEDKGIYDAWNKGLTKADGDWMAFLGADDFYWDENVIKNTIGELNYAQQHGIRYVYGKINLLSLSGDVVISVWGKPWSLCKKDIFQRMTVTHCGAFHHKNLFVENGCFNVQFKIAGDYELLLREFTKGKGALFSDRVFAGMRAGGISSSMKQKITVAKENCKAIQLNHLPVTWMHRLQIIKAQIAYVLSKFIGVNGIHILSDGLRVLKGKDRIWTKISKESE